MSKRTSLTLAVVLFAAAGLNACTSEPTGPDEDPPGLLLAMIEAAHSTADVFRLPAPAAGDPVGWSTVRRGPRGVSMSLATDLLPAGHAATVWAVIFNHPGACAASPCAGSDLDTEAVRGSVVRAAGSVVGQNGVHFAGRLRVGDASEALRGPGLLEPHAAEIHFIVRSHGPRILGAVDDQTGSAGGGCSVFVTPAIPDAVGECSDVAFSIHLP